MAPPRSRPQQKQLPNSPLELHTPQKSPQRSTMRITAAQKQALIDNLQLEVTERARKLRAQYSMQAQSLRTRIEMRVNRIPTAMRRANIGELHEKYEQQQRKEQEEQTTRENASAAKVQEKGDQQPTKIQPSKSRGKKRNSDAMEDERDRVKIHEDPIPNPKKRTKVTKEATSRGAANPSTVLSPKSANSRTLPHSPVRYDGDSPQKSMMSRPTSPLKPAVAIGKTGAAAATAALESLVNGPKAGRPKAKATKTTELRTAKKQPPVAESETLRTVSSASSSSAFSTGTTIVKPTKKTAGAAAKSVKKGTAPRAAPAKKVVAASGASSKGTRVLRTRG